MINRLFFSLLLFACTVALTAEAQIAVSSHTSITTINGQERVVTTCQTLMQDPQGPANYPGGVAAVCTLNQNGGLQTLPQCIGQPNAICSATLGSVIEGGNYQTTAIHGLFMQILPKGCIQNGVSVDCNSDPLSYGVNSIPALPPSRQFADQGRILPPFPPVGPSFWIPLIPGNNNALIASTSEPLFETAQVLPFVLHAKAKDVVTFRLNGTHNANWAFIGSGGTTVPGTPFQGITIDFHAPSTVPVQQVDTLTACKVDTSHGSDCNPAQIFVEILGVTIPPADWTADPPRNRDELLGGQTFKYNDHDSGRTRSPFYGRVDQNS